MTGISNVENGSLSWSYAAVEEARLYPGAEDNLENPGVGTFKGVICLAYAGVFGSGRRGVVG